MKIVCIGAGPAGLYFSILAKCSQRAHDITVVERNSPGETYGWGVVFREELLDNLYRSDPESARAIAREAADWDTQEVRIRDQLATHVGSNAFSVGRERLLEILLARATRLGVDVQFQRKVEDVAEFADADLIVACDGVNSSLRQRLSDHFQPRIELGRARYIWLGTDKVFKAFTFAFEETPAGWLWFHAYRFNSQASTCIVECQPETWEALGFDKAGPDETLRRLEELFRRHLDGHSLMHQPRGGGTAPWLQFKHVSNVRWYHDNIVLMGDAAHTTHFSVGSGTTLAIQDAIGLADKLRQGMELSAALQAYDSERRTALLPVQTAALRSAAWFEDVPRHVDQHATQLAYALVHRRGASAGWRYLVHLAQQDSALRGVLRRIHAARGWARSLRRAHAMGG